MKLVEAGFDIAMAADIAAQQGKGHIGELQQSATYTAAAGALLAKHRARPNPRANDPRVDVQIRSGGRTRAGAQVKVGSAAYVRRAVGRSPGGKLVANVEALAALAVVDRGTATFKLSYARAEAAVLSGDECHRAAAIAIEEALVGRRTELDLLVGAARTGARAGLETFALSIVRDVVAWLMNERPLNVGASADAAARAAGRAALRGSLQSYLLVDRFSRAARAEFCDRILHRVARSAVFLGAVADVLIETAIDLHAVGKGELTFDQLLRRVGVHSTTAAGGALGLVLAGAAFASGGWVLQLIAGLAGGVMGSLAGRKIGEALFLTPRRLAPA